MIDVEELSENLAATAATDTQRKIAQKIAVIALASEESIVRCGDCMFFRCYAIGNPRRPLYKTHCLYHNIDSMEEQDFCSKGQKKYNEERS